MPVHDWTRVEAGIFHAFHTTWVAEIQNALNEGVLPEGYYSLAQQALEALDSGIHLLLVELFPPGPHDPAGMHGVVRSFLEDSGELYDLPPHAPLTLASYAAGTEVEIYLEHLAPGASLAEMPL